jgi:hypothetical protein
MVGRNSETWQERNRVVAVKETRMQRRDGNGVQVLRALIVWPTLEANVVVCVAHTSDQHVPVDRWLDEEEGQKLTRQYSSNKFSSCESSASEQSG